MSVPTERRELSPTQFLDSAELLAEYSLKACKRFPTRWGHEITDDIRHDAMGVIRNLKAGNKIYVKVKCDAEMRRKCMVTAYAQLQSLETTIKIAADLFPLCGYLNRTEDGEKKKESLTEADKQKLKQEEKRRSMKILETWSGMIWEEMGLVKGIIDSDWDRFGHLLK